MIHSGDEMLSVLGSWRNETGVGWGVLGGGHERLRKPGKNGLGLRWKKMRAMDNFY